VVQLSLVDGLDAKAHMAIGKALRPLRDEGVLILGSGSSFHNMGSFFGQPGLGDNATKWDAYLDTAMAGGDGPRRQLLADWATAPGAKHSVPRAEHLAPLWVVAGAAHKVDAGRRVWGEANFMVPGLAMSSWQVG
jgi:aromatic ring-opening dioxygenase catalytic subunit (LigB family)